MSRRQLFCRISQSIAIGVQNIELTDAWTSWKQECMKSLREVYK